MNYLAIFLTVAVLSVSFVWGQDVPAGGDAYPPFAKFCQETFGAAKEPLTYQLPGEKLAFLDDGAWQYGSENSAVIAYETNLPASSWIDYGTSTKYGQSTEKADRNHYLHLAYLRDLKSGTTYHYRITAVDEKGTKITTPDKTFTPRPFNKAIYLPSSTQPKPPFKLDQAGALYVVKDDITAPGHAFAITAADVTLDLNGHTVVYNNDPNVKDTAEQKDFGQLAAQGVQGVRCGYSTRGANAKIYNGTIRQGEGNGGYGSVPIQARCAEIAGLTLDYHGTQISGVEGDIAKIHHNVITDHGSELTNRHQGVQAINGGQDVNHNLIRRVRQRGIQAQNGAKIYRNEIYIDSCATNSFGVMMYKSRDCVVSENRIFGGGYLAIGIGTVSQGVGNIKVMKNFIHLQATAPDNRWAEYGDQSGAYCVRVTWGGENVEYADNVLVSKARDGGMVRGVWFCPQPDITNVSFRRNTIKVLAENEKSNIWGALVISGKDDAATKPGIFEDNTVISNFCHVRLGEDYGSGVNAWFLHNTFIREGNRDGYQTVICGRGNFNNYGSVFAGNVFKDGTGLDHVGWEGSGRNDFSSGRLLKVKTTPGATVSTGGETPQTATADKDGVATLVVLQQTYTSDGAKDVAPPDKITATLNGKTTEAKLPAGDELKLPVK